MCVMERFNGILRLVEKKISEQEDRRKCPVEGQNQKDRKYRKEQKRQMGCIKKSNLYLTSQHVRRKRIGQSKF